MEQMQIEPVQADSTTFIPFRGEVKFPEGLKDVELFEHVLKTQIPDYFTDQLVRWKSIMTQSSGEYTLFLDNGVCSLNFHLTDSPEYDVFHSINRIFHQRKINGARITAELILVSNIGAKRNEYTPDALFERLQCSHAALDCGEGHVFQIALTSLLTGQHLSELRKKIVLPFSYLRFGENKYGTLRALLFDPVQSRAEAALDQFRVFSEYSKRHEKEIRCAAQLLYSLYALDDQLKNIRKSYPDSESSALTLERTIKNFEDEADSIISSLDAPGKDLKKYLLQQYILR